MGRLIDADKFKGKVIASHTGSGVIKLVAIDDVPTAYDPDKVVEQLEECAKWMCGSREAECPYIGNDEVDCERCAMLRAIEIVKGGGVDGQKQSQ